MSQLGVLGNARERSAPQYNHHSEPCNDDQRHLQWVEGQDTTRLAVPDTFYPVYHDPLYDDYIAESWLPQVQAIPSWTNAVPNENRWSHDTTFDGSLMSRTYDRQQQPPMLYTNFGTQYNFTGLQSPAVSTDYDPAAPTPEAPTYQAACVSASDDHIRPKERHSRPQTTQSDYCQETSDSPICGMSSFQLQPARFPNLNPYGGEFMQEQHISTWFSATEQSQSRKSKEPTPAQYPISPSQSSPSVTFGWSITTEPETSKSPEPAKFSPSAGGKESSFTITVPIPKRKAQDDASKIQAPWPDTTQKDISECVDVFENAPGALKTVKRRKKLDAPVRKAAREVRKAGACHQCKFRKRTCSTGTPCGSCIKNGGGLHEMKCQRESPFIGKQMHQYFQHSSTRRIINFAIKIPASSLGDTVPETVTIDGIGKISHPLQLLVRKAALSAFSTANQESIKQMQEPKCSYSESDDPTILILDASQDLGTKVEQWAVEYTSKFVHAAGPKFYATTMAHILGTAYVQKGLPESGLVASMLRASSIAFVLRAGIKSSASHPFRTIQANIDTILYSRLGLAQKDVFQQLQRLIFRSAGCLNRSQVYPVGLVLFQLLRFFCISASHLSNIAQRFRDNAQRAAEYQFHELRLLLSVHMALFRSSNPLLLDVSERFNRDLLGEDETLITLAMQMRKVVLQMKGKGFPELKGSITYKKDYFDQWRRVYDSK